MKLRLYQQQAHDAAIDWIKKCTSPCVLELPTGSGKSLIVAAIANTLHKVSGGKHILCLVPSKELLEQNAEKYRDTGNQCSLFSASVGETCLKHPVVFGTPVSVKNKIHRFGAKFCAVVLDEAHKISYDQTLTDLIREARKYGIGFILASQTPRDFDSVVFDNMGTKISLQLEGDDSKIITENFGLSDNNDKSALKNLLISQQPMRGLIRNNHYEPFRQLDIIPLYRK